MRGDGTVVFGGIASSASGESNASGPPRPRGQFCDAYPGETLTFKWVFERLPGMPNQDDFEPLLPRKWVQAQEAQQERAA